MNGLERIEQTSIATWVRESSWGYPAVEVVHILGLALLVGSAAMWDLRLLGLARRIPVSDLAGYLLPGARVGFLVAALSGVLLFAANAAAVAANPAFQLKLVVITLALINAGVFHARTLRSVTQWDTGTPPSPAARIAATFSLVLWTLTVVTGRLIAYV
jgi:hypothetical protein